MREKLHNENNNLQLRLAQLKKEHQDTQTKHQNDTELMREKLHNENNNLQLRLAQLKKEHQDLQTKYQSDTETMREKLTNEMAARNSLQLEKEKFQRVHSDWKTTLNQLTYITDKFQTSEAEKQKLSENLEKIS